LKDNGEIVQGSMVVGKYKINDLQSGNKIDKVDIAEFYLISDVIICKATKVADKDNEYQIYTYKDSKTITYTTEGDQLKSLTQFLVLKGYL